MIWEVFVNVVVFMLDSSIVLMLAGIPEPPAWAQEGFDALGVVWSYLNLMDHWIPVHFAVMAATAVLAAYAVVLVIGTIKLVASYLTLGGGAT